MKIRKTHFYLGLIVFVAIIGAVVYYIAVSKDKTANIEPNVQVPQWNVNADGYLSYPLDRGTVKFSRSNLEGNASILVSKIIFQSRGSNIYGLLVTPAYAETLPPGIVLLPGAGVSKESELELAKSIAELGIVVLVLDQRGTGETDGYFPNLDEDFASFMSNAEPYQNLMVYDALRAFDLLDQAPFVDSERIIIAGESLGGRIATIAAAIDRNIHGALIISSAGLDFNEKGDINKDRFLKSIDSDHYIDLITPRKIVMIHSINDSIIPLRSAANTFSKAEEPKQFILINDTSCNHGYCDAMWPSLVESLDYLTNIRSRTLVSVPETP